MSQAYFIKVLFGGAIHPLLNSNFVEVLDPSEDIALLAKERVDILNGVWLKLFRLFQVVFA